MSIFAPIAGSIWKQIEAYGLDPTVLFEQVGINPDVVFDQGARISYQEADQLTHLAVKLSGDPLFGLKGEEYFRPAHLGPLGFAWLASANLHAAFQRLSRYARVINEMLTITLFEDGSNLVVSFNARVSSLHESVREDAQMSSVIKCCRALAGNKFQPALVRYQQAEPVDTSFHYALFRCPIEFNAKATSMVIPLEVADKRLTGSNEELAQLNEHIVVKYLAHSDKKDIVNRTKAAIIEALGSGSATETMIAETLHTTPRNLHRKLIKENTSFKFLLKDVRQELAQVYIQDRKMSMTEISFMLGFSEVSSFSRAYKNWTGYAPTDSRQMSTQSSGS